MYKYIWYHLDISVEIVGGARGRGKGRGQREELDGDTYLFEKVWEALKVRDGKDASTVLRELMEACLELVQGSHSKEVHLCPRRLLEGVKDVAKSEAQGHVAGGIGRGMEGGIEGGMEGM